MTFACAESLVQAYLVVRLAVPLAVILTLAYHIAVSEAMTMLLLLDWVLDKQSADHVGYDLVIR